MASTLNDGESPRPPAASERESRKASAQQFPSSGDASEHQALALLQSAAITANDLARLARDPQTLKSRKLTLTLAMHARTPRHISIPLLRRLFTFDLMQVTLTPAVAADIKRAAENQILLRLGTLSIGEKVSLARRSSGRVAAELLRDADERVISAALGNSRLVETGVVTALMKAAALPLLFLLVSGDSKWSLRREVQIALLANENTPLDRAQDFAKLFPPELLSQIVPESRREALLRTRDKPNTASS